MDAPDFEGPTTLTLEGDLAVHIDWHGQLVAAVELVSPRDKGRPDSRERYARRYYGYIRQGVHLLLIDVLPRPAGFSFADALCGGSARRAERRFGWGRDAVGTVLHELASGIRCIDNFSARGRVRTEDADPALAADIRELVEPRTHADPELKTDRR